jgi:peptidoglycan/LPS O-acetylase OafA/YrhL
MEADKSLSASPSYIGGLAAVARRAIASTRFGLAAEGVAWLAVGIFTLAIWSFAGDPLKPIAFPLLLTYTPMILFCISRDITMPASIQKAVEAAGNMTYSSYLLQFPIQLMIVLGFAIARTPVPLYDEHFSGFSSRRRCWHPISSIAISNFRRRISFVSCCCGRVP